MADESGSEQRDSWWKPWKRKTDTTPEPSEEDEATRTELDGRKEEITRKAFYDRESRRYADQEPRIKAYEARQAERKEFDRQQLIKLLAAGEHLPQNTVERYNHDGYDPRATDIVKYRPEREYWEEQRTDFYKAIQNSYHGDDVEDDKDEFYVLEYLRFEFYEGLGQDPIGDEYWEELQRRRNKAEGSWAAISENDRNYIRVLGLYSDKDVKCQGELERISTAKGADEAQRTYAREWLNDYVGALQKDADAFAVGD